MPQETLIVLIVQVNIDTKNSVSLHQVISLGNRILHFGRHYALYECHLRMPHPILTPNTNLTPHQKIKEMCKHLIDPWIQIFVSFPFYVLSRVLMLVTQVSITYDK